MLCISKRRAAAGSSSILILDEPQLRFEFERRRDRRPPTGVSWTPKMRQLAKVEPCP